MNKRPPLYIFLLTFFFGSAIRPMAQVTENSGSELRETGVPYYKHFAPKEYRGDPQNWSVLQRNDGVILVGNGDGILAYDGAVWQNMPIANGNLVRCLATGVNGRVYVGGYNEIGYVDFQQRSPEYVSLIADLPQESKEFGHTWSITIVHNDVYFATDIGLFRWNGKSFYEVVGDDNVVRAFVTHHDERLFVQANAEPLSVVKDDHLQIVRGGEFYRGKRIMTMLPLGNGRYVIGTLTDGLFLYDGASSKPFAPAMLEFLASNRLYKGIRLRNGNMAFGTLQRGVIVLDNNGNLIQSFQKGSGLSDDVVYNLFEDREGGLWVASSVGLSRLESLSAMTVFNEQSGLQGAVNDITRFEGRLYVATMSGLFQLEPATTGRAHAAFRRVAGVRSSVWALGVAQGSLLAATDEGTIEIKGGAMSLLDEESGAVMMVYGRDRRTVFLGLADGVAVLQFRNGKWKSLGRIEGLVADVGEIKEDPAGNVWLGTFSEGAIRLNFNGATDDKFIYPKITRLGTAHGLPVGYLQMNRIGGKLMFRPEPHHTLYEYDELAGRFEPVIPSDIISGYDSSRHYPLAGETERELWIVDQAGTSGCYDLLRIQKTGNGYSQRSIDFARIREDFDEAIFEENGVLWMGGLDGVLRYEIDDRAVSPAGVNVVFNEITLGDSLIHCGVGVPAQGMPFPYVLNSIAFKYGATSFDLAAENEFQYQLEGFDDRWSSWTTHNTKSYTQIPEGDYIFNVRARNVYGIESEVTSFAFSVRPPWYRHPVAYAIYLLSLTGLIYAVVWMRSRKLEHDKKLLLQIIEDRTQEISSKNVQLEHQAEELKTQTEQLKEIDKLKTAFFSNISHEFRTPLSLIVAPLENKISEGSATNEEQIMYRNARRLQRLINQLLDLSRIESQQMKVVRTRTDLVAFVRSLTQSFTPLAENKNIAFVVELPSLEWGTHFDADHLETVLYNLLSNAFKFTPNDGRVIFSMKLSDNREECTFTISDNGMGIAHAEQAKVFDRFYQVESGVQRSFEGSGIGLALTRELVELMDGTITVTSKPGEGSTFQVILPLMPTHDELPVNEVVVDAGAVKGIAEPAMTQEETECENRPSITVLLVEDNCDLNDYLRVVLGKTYRVLTAFDGESGLQIARAEVPDLILSDMMMPRMDGFTLCEKIRSDVMTSHIPFVLLTARATVESRLAGLERGADEYLTKPFIVAELTTRIKNLLTQRQLLKEKFRRELTLSPQNVTVTSADEAFIRKVIEATELHLKDATFSVERLSEEVGISRKHLHRKLVALAGQTPNQFIRIFRLKTAMQLLQQQSGTVKEIAFNVGFNNLSYFAKCFKEEFGISPNEVLVPEMSV